MQAASVRVGFASILLVGVAGLFTLVISPPAHPMSPPPALVLRVRAAATGSGDGHDWQNAFPLFESALAAASSGDQIWVAEGTYVPPFNTTTHIHTFDVDKSLRIYGAFKGLASELSPADRQGSAALTILEGNLGGGANAEHVLTISQVAGSGGAPGVILDGFTVQNGRDLASGHGGGGVYCDGSDLQVVGCIIRNNAADYGGGLYFSISSGPAQVRTMWIESCEFRDNSAGTSGGAVFAERTYGDVVNSQFMGNSAAVHGGGVFLSNMSSTIPLVFVNSVFWANRALNSTSTTSLGGAVHLGESGSSSGQYSNSNFINCTLSDNYANGCQDGQAVYVSANSASVIESSILAFNGGASCSNIPPLGHPTTGSGLVFVDYSDLYYGSGSPVYYGIKNKAEDPLFRGHSSGGLTLKAGSPCIDAADHGQLPMDIHDLDGDLITGEPLPVDLIGADRFIDRLAEPNTGGPVGADWLDMGAYEKP